MAVRLAERFLAFWTRPGSKYTYQNACMKHSRIFYSKPNPLGPRPILWARRRTIQDFQKKDRKGLDRMLSKKLRSRLRIAAPTARGRNRRKTARHRGSSRNSISSIQN